MSSEELRQSIAALRREIQAAGDTDDEVNSQLHELADLLEQRLDKQAQPPEPDTHAQPEIRTETESDNAILTLVESYEARHPKITAMANDLMTRLMSMGI